MFPSNTVTTEGVRDREKLDAALVYAQNIIALKRLEVLHLICLAVKSFWL